MSSGTKKDLRVKKDKPVKKDKRVTGEKLTKEEKRARKERKRREKHRLPGDQLQAERQHHSKHPPQPRVHAEFDDPVLAAMAARRSVSKVGPRTPSDAELLDLLAAVTPVADHKALNPWRLLTLRGDDRLRLGAALDAAAGKTPAAGEKPNPKPLRAELLIAVIASPVEHPKVPVWEQHATAAGAAHLLELALWQAGWGVMWRTGLAANAPEVRALHGLAEHELLMGWLYVGDIDPRYRQRLAASRRPVKDPRPFLATLPAAEPGQ